MNNNTPKTGTFVDSLFEQAAQISKAHAYDIISQKAQELEVENKKLRDALQSILEINNYHDGVVSGGMGQCAIDIREIVTKVLNK